MSLPLTRATTFAEADESDPQEAVMSRPASRTDKMRAFITERSIFVRNRGHSSTTVTGRSGQRQSEETKGIPEQSGDSGTDTEIKKGIFGVCPPITPECPLPPILTPSARQGRVLYFASIS